MKKLELNQMESINGSTSGRNCMLMGFAAVAAIGLGPITSIGWGTSVSIGSGFFGGASIADCF